MATKTETLLEALAGERALPDYTCCATKTQRLIAEATERVNALSERVNALSDYTIEEFVFDLTDGTSVTKKIAIYN